MHTASSQYGPEYFLIVVGYSSDGKEAADTVASLQPDLQGELDKFRRVNPNIPFSRMEIWRWESHASAGIGGQAAVVIPEMNRANAAVFVFNERVGPVTWDELNLIRSRIPPIPVLPFFPAKPPSDSRLMDEDVSSGWADLLRKRRELSRDWTDPDSKAITPLPQYIDLKDLKRLAFERLTTELVRIVGAFANNQPAPSEVPAKKAVPTALFGVESGQSSARKLEASGDLSGGHVLCVAPTATARQQAVSATNLAGYAGAVLVADPTGQIYQSTSEAREAFGPIVKLDPWSLVPDRRVDSLNPLDIVTGLGLSMSEGARYLADFIVPYQAFRMRRLDRSPYDPFWTNMERKLLVGLILLAATEAPENKGVLSRIRSMLHGDDTVYNFALELDTIGRKLQADVPEAYQEIASFLQQVDTTRLGIIATVAQHFGAFGSLVAQRSTDSSSFDVKKWIVGDPMTVYVIGPPPGVSSFETIYNLWYSCLLSSVLTRPRNQERPTLFILDINENFEMWPGLLTALTQSTGCQVCAVVSDISYLSVVFCDLEESILSSFSSILATRPNNLSAAERTAKVLGLPASELTTLGDNDVLLSSRGGKAIKIGVPDKR